MIISRIKLRTLLRWCLKLAKQSLTTYKSMSHNSSVYVRYACICKRKQYIRNRYLTKQNCQIPTFNYEISANFRTWTNKSFKNTKIQKYLSIVIFFRKPYIHYLIKTTNKH